MSSQHQWDRVVMSQERRWLHPLAAIPLFLLWLFAGIPIVLALALRHMDHGFDLRKADHAIAALMIPGVAIVWYLELTIGPLVIPHANDYQIDSFSRAIEILAVNLALLAVLGLARLARLAVSR